MRLTLPKNRTLPLILFAIFSVLVSLILGLYHVSSMANYCYYTKLDTYDSLSKNLAVVVKQEIDNKYRSLQEAADLISKAEINKDNIGDLLELLDSHLDYKEITIVSTEGTGISVSGERVDVSSEDYFIKALNGLANASDEITYTEDNTPVIVYAVPIIDNGRNKGVLIAKDYATINNLAVLKNETENGSVVYLIGDNGKLISYAQDTDIKTFNYNEIIAKGHFLRDKNITKKNMSFHDIFAKDSDKDKNYIWIEEKLGINNWSLLIGRTTDLGEQTRNILRLTNIMWIIVTCGITLLFIILIYFQRKSDRKVIKSLYMDPVTGGDNWYKFRIVVSKILNGKQFGKKRFALINFDINRFKIINDAYGYQKGDEVLKDIYFVIKKWVRPGEPFTRYAADQFYILINFDTDEEVIQRINDLNDRIHKLKYMNTVKIFYGIYFVTERLDSIDRMGEFASIAKNNIKGSTESFISFFDDNTRKRLLEEERIEKCMNEALENEEFQIYLQPKYSAKNKTIEGAEALVRWYNSNGSLVSPGNFIPVFEKNGFITELDFYMLRKICGIIREWMYKGYTPLPISVNISRLHFANPHLAELIKDIVDDYGVPHSLIELELTESAFLQNKQALIKAVKKLRSYGFLVSMDDFGAGYSSLNSLKDLPLDVVKLDGELFRLTNEIERGLTVIRNTINMAKDLHMKVVAECIETKEQVDFLCKVGCDIIQGYYFAKPMPVHQFEELYF